MFKLKSDQTENMTKFLISMKSEYDFLIRDGNKTKQETLNLTVIIFLKLNNINFI